MAEKRLDSYPSWDKVEDVELVGVGTTSGTTVNPLISDVRDHDPKAHTHTSADVTDFDSQVSANTDVSGNTAARHTHSNQAVLDDLGDDGSGNLTYKGSAVGGGGGGGYPTNVFVFARQTASDTYGTTATTLNFDTVDEDTAGAVSTPDTDFTFTAPEAGLYHFIVQTGTHSRQTGELWVRMMVGGVEVRSWPKGEQYDNWTSIRFSHVIRLATSDQVKFDIWTSAGATGGDSWWEISYITITKLGN